MSKIAVLFPGQGAQKAGMGKEFYEQCAPARRIYDLADQVLDLDIKELCFTDHPLLHQTAYTQAALVTTELAIYETMKDMGITADVTAGLSLGEYSALAAAGILDPADAIRLVRKRGIFMEEAVPSGVGSMAAVLGLTAEQTDAVLEKLEGVQAANYNCPGQIVISGYAEAVERAGEELKKAGAKRVLPLRVSGPFHSALLEGAGKRLAGELAGIRLQEPEIPYVANVTAEYVTGREEVKVLLERQVASSVRWQQSVEQMAARGVDVFIEAGPGRTLSGFVKKIVPKARVMQVETPEDLKQLTI